MLAGWGAVAFSYWPVYEQRDSRYNAEGCGCTLKENHKAGQKRVSRGLSMRDKDISFYVAICNIL